MLYSVSVDMVYGICLLRNFLSHHHSMSNLLSFLMILSAIALEMFHDRVLAIPRLQGNFELGKWRDGPMDPFGLDPFQGSNREKMREGSAGGGSKITNLIGTKQDICFIA